MRTRTWSRIRAEAVWTLALLLGVPALAEAQQTGLFPLRPIKRQRPPCAAEDPLYRQHREMYFGYFPTCWRKFPPGWGCQSAEAPNADASFNKYPRGNPPELPEDQDRGGMRGDDEDLAPRGGMEPGPDQGAAPPLPPSRPNLFDLDNPKPGNNPQALPPPSTPPNRSTPGAAATTPAAAAEAGLAPREADSSQGPADAIAPLPGAPTTEAPPASNGNPLPAVEAPASVSNDPDATPSTQPERAPQRRSLLGALFGGLWRR